MQLNQVSDNDKLTITGGRSKAIADGMIKIQNLICIAKYGLKHEDTKNYVEQTLESACYLALDLRYKFEDYVTEGVEK